MVFRKIHGVKKSYYMCVGRNTKNYKFELDNLALKNGKEEVVLVVTIDKKLTLIVTLKTFLKKLS